MITCKKFLYTYYLYSIIFNDFFYKRNILEIENPVFNGTVITNNNFASYVLVNTLNIEIPKYCFKPRIDIQLISSPRSDGTLFLKEKDFKQGVVFCLINMTLLRSEKFLIKNLVLYPKDYYLYDTLQFPFVKKWPDLTL